MFTLRLWAVFCLLLVSSVHHALSTELRPILELYDFVPDPSNIINLSGCKRGLINGSDFFTIRGKVNRNGANPEVFRDTSLYLVADPNRNAWTFQCQLNLTVCGSDLNTDCYCERKDADGYYHLVMTIMVKSIYADGKLMLSWIDVDNPFKPPISSNAVKYYPGPIHEQKIAYVRSSGPKIFLDTDPSSDRYNNLSILYTPKMRYLDFYVHSKSYDRYFSTTKRVDGKVYSESIELRNIRQNSIANVSFEEYGGCKYTGSYNFHLKRIDQESQEPLPIMELYDVVLTPNNIINHSGCKNGLVNDIDFLILRGTVSKNGSNPEAFTDTSLFLSFGGNDHCQLNLTVCGSDLNTDCYCERKDEDGKYHLVMKIMVKFPISKAYVLKWKNEHVPLSSPKWSNAIGYFPGPFWDHRRVTLEIGATEMVLDVDPMSTKYKSFYLTYTPEMTNLTLCVYNLGTLWLIKIEEGEDVLAHTMTESCVTTDIEETRQNRVLNLSFVEFWGCERTGSYILHLASSVTTIPKVDTTTRPTPTNTTTTVIGQEPLPIMELYDFVLDNVINLSGCKNGLINGTDFFTLRGKVNRNGAHPEAYTDTSLYLLVIGNHSTNIWAPQCQLNLTVCGSDLNTDCYCERKDADGYYHLVMTIMVKSIYADGSLMLSWIDLHNPFRQPITSNKVKYYPGPIHRQKKVWLRISYEFENVLDGDPSSDKYKNFSLFYSKLDYYFQYTVYNLESINYIQVTEGGEVLDKRLKYTLRKRESHNNILIDLQESREKINKNQVWNMSFSESGGCERNGSYILHLLNLFNSQPQPIMELYELVLEQNNIISHSGCKDGLVDETDFFILRGKVNKNRGNPEFYTDTSLYLEASKYRHHHYRPELQECQVNLSVCGSDLNTDCYCERKDADGYYHLVMTIKAKSIYSGHVLRLFWGSGINLEPGTSNEVSYPAHIRVQRKVTLEIGATKMVLDADPSSEKQKNFFLTYTQEMTRLTFCVYSLESFGLIQIEEGGEVLAHHTSNPCIGLDIGDTSQSRMFNMSFVEFWGCERTGSYILHLMYTLPIMELYDFVLDNVINHSGCKNGLVNDNDFFIVRGKVSKNGANPEAFTDSSLYLRAVKDPRTKAWSSQCQLDLSICGSDLNTDCYCERKDADGYYHLVMTIKAKSIYTNGALMLSWNDKSSPFNPPRTSNMVDYYPGPIWDLSTDLKKVTLELRATEMVLDMDPSSGEFKKISLTYPPKMTSLAFCVYNLESVEFIQIAEGEKVLAHTMTESCVTADLKETNQSRVLNMSFAESEKCERSGSYILDLEYTLPSMELYDLVQDPNNITNLSGCKVGLVNDIDFFTVRGKVNKNGANPEAFRDTNLYLAAVTDSRTKSWASQCRLDLTVCSNDRNTDCYCERIDADGYYHLVMRVVAKSIYTNGALMLRWYDARSLYNSPITSNIVDYYPGPICDQKKITLKVGATEMVLDGDPSSDEFKDFSLTYTSEMTSLTFCVYNLESVDFIQIEEGEEVLAHTMTESCVTADLRETNQSRVLNMSFVESEGCQRTGSYTLHLESKSFGICQQLGYPEGTYPLSGDCQRKINLNKDLTLCDFVDYVSCCQPISPSSSPSNTIYNNYFHYYQYYTYYYHNYYHFYLEYYYNTYCKP